ncbi:uncharacterized protein BDV14DRAFT_198917 [Aspergillus stella-maris]|uniref:uncharacterized protein n=1 Tax=Aspergillus stella-maris TaxID=1810926 RepID=UPI003CCD4913
MAIHGDYGPSVEIQGVIENETERKESEEPLMIHVMHRMPGVGYLDFILANTGTVDENSQTFSAWRRNLVSDVARFFATSWKTPQPTAPEHRDTLRQTYTTDPTLLLDVLPPRFHTHIERCLSNKNHILSRQWYYATKISGEATPSSIPLSAT